MKQFNARNMFLSNIKTCNKKKKDIEIIKKNKKYKDNDNKNKDN